MAGSAAQERKDPRSALVVQRGLCVRIVSWGCS